MCINQQGIAQSTRKGGPDRLKLTEALYDEKAKKEQISLLLP